MPTDRSSPSPAPPTTSPPLSHRSHDTAKGFTFTRGNGIFDDRGTVIGLGTHGLGDKCKDSAAQRVKLEYKKWLREKNDAKIASPPQAPPPARSPREISAQGQQAREKVREQVQQDHRERAAEVLKERKDIKVLLETRKHRSQKQVHDLIMDQRKYNTERRKTMIQNFEDAKEADIRRLKEEEEEIQDSWKNLLEEERRQEMERIKKSKAAWQRKHDFSQQVIQSERDAKIARIREEKAAEKAKMDKWRQEMNERQRNLQKAASQSRQNIQQSVEMARSTAEQSRREEVKAAREVLTEVKKEHARRKERRMERQQRDTEIAKQAAQSHYLEQLEVVRGEKRAAAEEVRRRQLIDQAEIERDRAATIQRAKDMRQRPQAIAA